jgi:predicted nuclease of predicted toxin-antitoxin system
LKDSSPSFFVDNNLGVGVAAVLRELGLDARHLREDYPEDALDEVWLAAIGAEGRCLITRDLSIRTNRRLKDALKRYRVGAFFLGGKNRSARELIEQAVSANRLMEEAAASARRPFAFIVRPGGRSLVKLPLD